MDFTTRPYGAVVSSREDATSITRKEKDVQYDVALLDKESKRDGFISYCYQEEFNSIHTH